MTASAAQTARSLFPGVRPPKPLLPPDAERRLTERQRQVLEALEGLVVRGGLAELTMAEIASFRSVAASRVSASVSSSISG